MAKETGNSTPAGRFKWPNWASCDIRSIRNKLKSIVFSTSKDDSNSNRPLNYFFLYKGRNQIPLRAFPKLLAA